MTLNHRISPFSIPSPTKASPAPSPTTSFRPTTYQEAERATNARVAAFRVNRGLLALAYSEVLSTVARAHSEDMARRGFFDHVNPDGLAPQDRVERAGITSYSCGENLYTVSNASQDDAEHIASDSFTGWLNSPGHYENMITPRWDSGGVGVYVVQRSEFLRVRYDIWVTHLLCKDMTEYNRIKAEYEAEKRLLEQMEAELERLKADHDRLRAEYKAVEERYVNNQASKQEVDAAYGRQEEARLRFNQQVELVNQQVAVVNQFVERLNAAAG
ncbi:MAG: hypothetical protein HY533_05045 [Chloroflexi bacterium]|nr:hypothetical protein [Chloroflexota bacterium]